MADQTAAVPIRNSQPLRGTPPADAYWSRETKTLLDSLQSSAKGLSSGEARTRLSKYGPNALKAQRQTTLLGLFIDQFKSPIVLILLFATVVSALLGDLTDAIIISVIVLGSAILSLIQEYSANTAAEKLRAQIKVKADVLRDGQKWSIPADEVVPGDVVLLSAGSLIPADGVLLEGHDLFVNQAILTGETFPVEKTNAPVKADASLTERTNTVFMGTNVRSGTGTALVVQTGKGTAFGQIAARLRLRPPETEFERGIRHLGYLLTEVMFILVIGVFAFNVLNHQSPIDSLLFSVALAVGLTPQLLPAIININLARGSRSMAKKGVIVRRLSAIENFGSMDVLCTDKTGTLTEGVIKLDSAVGDDGKPSDDVLRLAYINAKFQSGLTNPLDDAILQTKNINVSGIQKIDEIPYDFSRKRLSVVVQEDDKRTMITKGALDNVLAICPNILSANGHHLMPDDIEKQFTEWSGKGFRVLGVATKDASGKDTFKADDEHDMTFAGFLLFFDPPKQGVKDTIADLMKLGVQLKIITGDNKLVAQHTAEAIDLKVTGILTGHDIQQMAEDALLHAADKANLFADVDPNQKERIILAVRKMGHVVGYMGDGINDAPPLHAADVGLSVENAADVAKDAADFVLSKQDLSVLHDGILEGRKTFANTLKYVFMAVSANFGNMFSVAGASLFLPFLPMLPKQILLINFLTDFPEFTIAGDRVDDVLVQQPRRWNIAFIRRFMLVFGVLSSVFDYITFGLLLLVLDASKDQALFHTTWFVESILSATFVVFVLRTRLPITKSLPSRLMITVTMVIAGITLLLPYSPLAAILGFEALPLNYLLAIFGIVALYLLSAEFTKRLFYRWQAAAQ